MHFVMHYLNVIFHVLTHCKLGKKTHNLAISIVATNWFEQIEIEFCFKYTDMLMNTILANKTDFRFVQG